MYVFTAFLLPLQFQASEVVSGLVSEHIFDRLTHLTIHISIQGASLSAAEKVHFWGIVVKPEPPLIGLAGLKVEWTESHDDLSTRVLLAWADLEVAILAWAWAFLAEDMPPRLVTITLQGVDGSLNEVKLFCRQ